MANFTAATVLARHGFRVIPVVPGGKTPLARHGFRHAAKSATADPERVRDAWLAEPAANIGLAPDEQYVILDIDPRNGGSLECAEGLGLPVDGYRERSGGGGWHVPLAMPHGVLAVRSTVLAPGVEVKGPGSYAVSPASRLASGDAYTPEPGRDCWYWPVIPSTWPLLDQLTEPSTPAAYHATAGDARAADLVMDSLLASHRGPAARACLDAVQGERSEADFRLVRLAATLVWDHPRRAEILSAVLHRHSRKVRTHRNPDLYCSITVANALSAGGATPSPLSVRDSVRATIARGTSCLSSPPSASPYPPTCDDGTRASEPDTITVGILGFLQGVEAGSPWAGMDGWVRLPVEELASALDCSRRTVSRRLGALEAGGTVARRIDRKSRGGRFMADSWVRLITTSGSS